MGAAMATIMTIIIIGIGIDIDIATIAVIVLFLLFLLLVLRVRIVLRFLFLCDSLPSSPGLDSGLLSGLYRPITCGHEKGCETQNGVSTGHSSPGAASACADFARFNLRID